MELGRINTLTVQRQTDHGFYLMDDQGNEVLLPNAYAKQVAINDEINVFVYNDSEDRPIATTQLPRIQLDEFAYLQAKDVQKFGAFMDWGLPKDLLIPFSEQAQEIKVGQWYPVFLIKDLETDRLIGSTKINKHLYFDDINLNPGDEVELFIFRENELGVDAVVNNMFKGLIFKSDIHKPIQVGDHIKGYVKQVREDGKIDLSLAPIGYKNSIDPTEQQILSALDKNNGFLALHDKSNPDEIKQQLGLSKKAFKKGIGSLYKQKLISIEEKGIKKV